MKNNSVDDKINVNKFAAIIGKSLVRIPYTSHNATPAQKNENIPNDKSLAEPDFQVLITWGRNEIVVQKAATRPMIWIEFISNIKQR